MVAAQGLDRLDPQADADVLGGILDFRGNAGGVDHPPADRSGRSLEQRRAFLARELGDLGRQAKDRDALHAGAQAGTDLQAKSVQVQRAVRAEKRVLHRHDAVGKRFDGVSHLVQLIERARDRECCTATVVVSPGKLLTLRAREGRLHGCGRIGRMVHSKEERI